MNILNNAITICIHKINILWNGYTSCIVRHIYDILIVYIYKIYYIRNNNCSFISSGFMIHSITTSYIFIINLVWNFYIFKPIDSLTAST